MRAAGVRRAAADHSHDEGLQEFHCLGAFAAIESVCAEFEDGRLKPIDVSDHVTVLPRGHRWVMGGRSFVALGGTAHDTTVWSLAANEDSANVRLLDLDTLSDASPARAPAARP